LKAWLYKLPAILYTLLIFILSAQPQEKLPPLPLLHIDKIVHIIEYAIYGFFLMLAYTSAKTRVIYKQAFWISLATGILYAASDEFHQLYVAGRHSSFIDWLADSVGVLLGILIFRKLKISAKLAYDHSA